MWRDISKRYVGREPEAFDRPARAFAAVTADDDIPCDRRGACADEPRPVLADTLSAIKVST